jgi:hypothetical protein
MVGVMMLNSSIGAEVPATLVYYLDAAAQGAFPGDSITTSASFNGSTQNLSVPNSTALNPGTGDFTIEFWTYLNSTTNNASFYRGNNGGVDVFMNGSGKLAMGVAQISTLITDSATMTTASWVHVAVVRASGTTTLYKNGTSVGSAGDATNYVTDTANYIGSNPGGPYRINGYISNLRVVIGTAVYTTSFTPPTSTLRAISGTALLLPLTAAPFMDLSTNLATVTNTGTVTTTASAPSLTAATTDVTGTYTLSSSNTSGRISWSTDQGGVFRNTFSGDGINAYITGGPDWSAATRSYTVFIAYKLTGTSNYGRLVNSNTFSPDFLIGGYSSKSKALYSDGGQVNLAGPVDTVWHLDWGRYNKKTTTGSLFSVTTAQPTSTPAYTATVSMNAFNQLKLFSKADGNECAAGDIGVIRVWDGAMTTAQMQAEWAAFHTRFGY